LSRLAHNITTVIVNYKTCKLVQVCYESFRKVYSDIPVILIDNHSCDDSVVYIKSVGERDEHTTSIFNSRNIGHGPALAQAIKLITTPFVFTLDSDCEIKQGGFLEIMLQEMDNDDNLYAIGWRRWVNKETGVPLEWHSNSSPSSSRFIPYIHPYAALYRLSMYHTLHPFIDHGAPCILNMNDVTKAGYNLKPFKLDQYIKHWKAGTRRLFDGHWHPKENVRPKPWVADRNYPI